MFLLGFVHVPICIRSVTRGEHSIEPALVCGNIPVLLLMCTGVKSQFKCIFSASG